MKTSDRLNEIDSRLTKIEVLLTNHLWHTRRTIYLLAGALLSASLSLAVKLF